MKPEEKITAKRRILIAAHDLFYDLGIRATGVDRIIKASGVAKVTFYRHFPSKNDLILAFLEYRHELWVHWFKDALQRHGNTLDALPPALQEWFDNKTFRGCAFLNTVAELATELPEVVEITQSHKQDMTDIIATLIPAPAQSEQLADVIAVAVDGTIIQAQFSESPDVPLMALERIIKALLK